MGAKGRGTDTGEGGNKMKKMELEAIIAERIREAEQQGIYEKACTVAKAHGRAYDSVEGTDPFGPAAYYDTAWRIDFKDVNIDYRSECYVGRKLTIKFNSAKVFHAEAEYDRHHNEFHNLKIKSYVWGDWVGHLEKYFTNPSAMQKELREEQEKKWKKDRERAWRESPEAPDREMEEAEKNFGIKKRREK